MAFSNSIANKVLDIILGGAAYTPETNVKIALFTSTPALDGSGGTEVSGGNYSRVTKANNATNFPNAASRAKSNGTAITFPQASAGWGAITAVGIYANDGTTLMMLAVFDTPKTVSTNDVPSYAIGQLTFTMLGL